MITMQFLTRKLKLGSLSFPHEYEITHVRNLRVSGPFIPDGRDPLRGIKPETGSIAFDYSFKTYRFGESLDEAEAKTIVEEILKRYPSLAKPS